MIEFLSENWPRVLDGFWITIQLAVLSGVGSVVLGTVLAAMRVGPAVGLARAAGTYVTLVRNTPLLVVCLIVFTGLPEVGIDGPFLAKGVLSVTLYTSPFICEALRSGINSVPMGQAEAARSIGLDFSGTMRQVVLPQAFAASIPPMTSVLIAMLKNTSVTAAFGLAEATSRMKGSLNDNADIRIQVFLVFAIGYIILVEIISAVGIFAERKTAGAR